MYSLQKGFFNLSSLIMLILIGGGMGFMYMKGYRVNVDSDTVSSYRPFTAETKSEDRVGRNFVNEEGLFYTVQVSVTPTESNAANLVQRLKNDGYEAYYDTYDTDRGRIFKVRVGQYADKQSAAAVKTQVRRRYQQFRDSFVNLVDN